MIIWRYRVIFVRAFELEGDIPLVHEVVVEAKNKEMAVALGAIGHVRQLGLDNMASPFDGLERVNVRRVRGSGKAV